MTSEEKEQLDIQYLYRGENLWQFRIAEHTPDYHTKRFLIQDAIPMSRYKKHASIGMRFLRKIRIFGLHAQF